MAGVNKVILIGNLGKDPEVRYLEGGTAVANFSLATSESYKDKTGKRVDQTEWHNIVAWRGLAEVAEKYLKKGMQVFIEGKIRTRKWQDKEGKDRYTTEILADTLTMLGRKEDGAGMGGSSYNSNQNTVAANAEAPIVADDGSVDDLPF